MKKYIFAFMILVAFSIEIIITQKGWFSISAFIFWGVYKITKFLTLN